MAQQLRILPVEGLWSVPSIYMGWLKLLVLQRIWYSRLASKGTGTHAIHIHNADTQRHRENKNKGIFLKHILKEKYYFVIIRLFL